ncbi:zinc transporter ZIP1-like [Eublepharis macularius]|uniref:Zinc transporter ZIP1-like n=1 Tax=Eublepharis macularius TaxID=481883 RepID=A0AA97KNP2_EUBMA|nr:zinc transporter ZIP1-like [Eublepharis macularius]
MWSLLALKLGALVALGLLPLLCALLPAVLRRVGGPGCGPRWRSLLSGAAGGVFLATCLLDVVPDSLEHLREELSRQSFSLDFPMPELILALGFLLVLVIEHVALDCSEPQGDEATPLLSACPAQHHSEEAGLEQQASQRPSRSSFRYLVLMLALSLHSVFEGLAVGLQDSESKVLQLAGAILLHKSIVAASLGLLLLQSRLPLLWLAAALGTFVLMSPLGVGLGMAVTHSSGMGSTTTRSILEGVAAGTFMYITFLEILPQELSSSDSRLPKVLTVLLGFSGMAGLRLLG